MVGNKLFPWWCVLDQQSGVTSRSTEVVDKDTSRVGLCAFLPLRRLQSNANVSLFKISGEAMVDLVLDAAVWNDGVLLQHLKDLDHTADTRGSLTVADI